MIGRIWRGVQLMQRVNDEATVAQELDPLAVAAVELDSSPGSHQAVCPALRAEQFLAAGPSGPEEHRVTSMLVVWNTSFPPGRSSRAASGTQRAGSYHKLAPHSDSARSKRPGAAGYLRRRPR